MKPKLIIPCLDTRNGKLVKGVRFMDVRDVGDPPEFARRYEEQGADELVLLDITATPENRTTLLDVVRRTSKVISVPLTVGGGIKSVAEARAVLEAGATRVSVNTAAVRRPELLRELSREFGSESVTCAIDGNKKENAGWEVYVNGGMQPTGIDMIEWAKRVESLGAGGILYTGVHTDGTRNGYDIEGTRAIAEAVSIPVIASGGAGSLEHIYRVLTDGKADAALAASIFHFEVYTVKEVKEYLREMGVAVR
ncbi:MAG: imidazole glycerol phosphate synthase subunit HisF [Candidatus Hadarchaeales archaeon]